MWSQKKISHLLLDYEFPTPFSLLCSKCCQPFDRGTVHLSSHCLMSPIVIYLLTRHILDKIFRTIKSAPRYIKLHKCAHHWLYECIVFIRSCYHVAVGIKWFALGVWLKRRPSLRFLPEALNAELYLPHSDLHTSVNKQTNKMARCWINFLLQLCTLIGIISWKVINTPWGIIQARSSISPPLASFIIRVHLC